MNEPPPRTPRTIRRIGRRSFIRSAATGLSVAVPALELLRPQQAVAATPLDKLVLFHFPYGAHPEDWSTIPTGPIAELPEMLSPLAAHREGVVVLSGLSTVQGQFDGPCTPGNPHIMPSMTCLTGGGLICGDNDAPINRSLDHAAAEALGPAQIPSLYTRVFGNPMNLSYATPGAATSVPPIRQPNLLFTQLFADGALTPEALQTLKARRLSVLDFVTGEVAELEKELGAADRQRLDLHLTTMRQLELRAQATTEQCEIPDEVPPDTAGDPPDAMLEARADDLMDLAMLALRCDLTNVLLFSMGTFTAQTTYSFLEAGVPPHTMHQTSHMQAGDTVEEQRFWWRETNRYHISKFARMLDLLAGSDGADPLLSRTAAVCFSEMGKGTIHSPYNIPCFVAGGDIAGGRHVHHPCSIVDPSYPAWGNNNNNTACTDGGEQTPIASLWLTVLQALGGTDETFGEADSPLPDLW